MVDPRTLRVLEFPKIQQRLAELTVTAAGRELAEALQPAVDLDSVSRALQETSEGVALLSRGEVPLRGTSDIRDLVRRARIGSALDPAGLLLLRDTLATIRQCRSFVLTHREHAPSLAVFVDGIAPFDALEAAIRRTVADDGSIFDGASADLARVRKEQEAVRSRITQKLDDLIRGPQARMLQDPLIMTRSDRYVVPVRQEFKSQFPGVLHDQSSSGATVFMEPLAIVPLGNELRELEIAEREEILKILRDLTAVVSAGADRMVHAYETLGRIDFAEAKALLAASMQAVAPRLRTDGILRLRRARHPLLTGDVVPIDVEVGEDWSTLVITGPNTGGKTVTLKTIGLLTLMAQSGLYLPADDGTEAAVFVQVFADIGDEQSIEQSLSTFSSHMGAIAGILTQLSAPHPPNHSLRSGSGQAALVLLDEIGAGTDPAEGVSLARALIEHLHRVGARTVVTTHYSELKALVYAHPGIQNASVEFDAETLRPTYRLRVGVPGRSNALYIAERLGLDPQIVERARELLGPEVVAIDRILSDIEADRRAYEYELAEAARHRQEATELQTRAAQELDRLRAERRKVLSRLREEADALLVHARAEIEAIVTSLKTSAPQAMREARGRLRALAEELSAKVQTEAAPEGEPLTEVKPGQVVYILPLRLTGTVRSAGDSRGDVEVEAGAVRVKVQLAALRAVPAQGPPPPVRESGRPADLAPAVPASLSLRGTKIDDAIPILDKYLDDALVAGLRQVTVIHGKGTGTLRKAVHDFLRSHPHVKSYRLGQQGEGDSGATVVDLL